MTLIPLVWVLEYDLKDINPVVSLGVRFPPSDKRILSMLLGVVLQGLWDQS